MLRIVAIAMLVLVVAFAGCLGGDKKPAEVEPTPAATVAPTVAPTPVATPVATATQVVEEAKTADASELFTPKESDLKTPEAIAGCEDLDQSILKRYDVDGDGQIDDQWTVNAGIDLDSSRITQDGYNQIRYAYEHGCPVDVDTK
ncbi:hypothetical protein DRO03_05480 [Methanosarcinales archaeon]|nr:MAG: hypothetical protein DRO03_05480 [Methanosarcinales archaeon]